MSASNPPAFPTNGTDYNEGMTLRDWFAGQLASGMVSDERNLKRFSAISGGVSIRDVVADLAYDYADALLAKRAKGSEA